MNVATRVRLIGGFSAGLLLALLLATPRGSLAADASDQLLAEQLAAGEFGPALQAADELDDQAARDARLHRIATAQAQAGARNASLNTVGSMADDVARTKSLRELAPIGPDREGRQGGAQADFNSLMDLITTTIAPQSWDEVGGPGAIQPFRGGVYVDAEGVLRKTLHEQKDTGLAAARVAALEANANRDAQAQSGLRKLSLPRLEKQLQLRLAAGHRPTDEMCALAGIEKIKYVMVYPETGDLVIAGPAGPWMHDADGRLVSQKSGRPVLQLDDLVVIVRHLVGTRDAKFGCSINPTEAGLARTQAFVAESNKTPLKEGQRASWLKKLREQLGRQEIDVDGIDPRTRVAQVLVEADYRMKLVGMGLEPGVLGVKSYLDSIEVPRGEAPPPMDVLRWWFTMNYNAVRATENHDAFELRGQGVQVLSENEMLTALGKRVHSGKSEPLNLEFTQSFTQHFPELAVKYPVYADLQNLFDVALVAALIKAEDLPNRIHWHLPCFLDPQQYQVTLGAVPQTVDTVINHRVINKVHVVAGISGGVSVDPWKYVSPKALEVDKYGTLKAERSAVKPAQAGRDAWWWD